MNALVSPIATPEVSGTPVRFFKSPEAGPHMPWHAVDDLYRALRFPRDLRRIMLRNAQGFAGGDFKTIATTDGPVVIGSHPMAQGLIGAAIEAHGTNPGFDMLYAKAAVVAMQVLAGDLGPEAKLDLLLTAARNTLGLAGGGVLNAPIVDLGEVRRARAADTAEPSLVTFWGAVEAAHTWAFAHGAERPWSLHQEFAFHTQAPDERTFAWLLRQGVEHPALFGDADGGGWPLVMGRAERVGTTFGWRPEDGARALVFLARNRDGLDDDIVCWWPRDDRVASLHGAALLGAESLDEADEPIEVHAGVLEWLRAGRRGVVMVNQRRAVPLLREAKGIVVTDVDFGIRLERTLTLKAPPIRVRQAA